MVLVSLVAALLALIGWPLARLVGEGLGGGPAPLLAALEPTGLVAIANSLWVAVAVTTLAVAGGLGLALLVEHAAPVGRSALIVGIGTPLVVPDFVTALGWTRAYGPAGLMDRAFGIELPGLYGPFGVVLVIAAGSVPLAFLLIVAGMRVRAEPDLVRAARISGADAPTALRTVTIPLLWPVLAAAGGILFAAAMNAFGTPVVLGRPAGFATMTTQIYGDLAFSSSDRAFERVIGLSLVLVTLVVSLVLVADRVGPRGTLAGVVASPRGHSGRAGRLATLLAWSFVVLTVAVPLLALVLTALTRAVGLAPLPEHLTLANFGRAIDSRTAPAIANSLLLAAAAAAACIGLGLAATLAPAARWRRPVSGVIATGYAIPGSVLAVGLLLAFGRSLRDTLLLILLAYVAKLWILAERPIGGAAARVSSAALPAARVYGAGPWTALRSVVLPLLLPTIAAAGLLVFVTALQEVTISILLYGPRTATLAVSILNLQQLGDPTVTAALAVLLTGLVGACCVPLALLLGRWGGARPG